jgi:hypothetical protein
MTSIDSRTRSTMHRAFVALVAMALLAGSLAVYAASPSKVLAASKVIDVTLSVGRTISGTILKRTSPTTTAAAPNIDIQACLVSTTQYVCRSATTALNGTYLVNQLVPGKYTVEIINYDDAVNLQSGWYTTANTAHFNVAPAGASQVDVTLGNKAGINSIVPIGFKISGIVHLGTTATSVAGVPVQVCTVTGYSCRSATTIAGGVYTVQGLAPGQYTIGASKNDQNYVDGYYRTLVANNFALTAALATKLTITTANLTGKTFTLPVGFKITGFVKTTANVAIAGAGVTVSGIRYRTASTTSTGAFTIQGLPAGTYQLGVANPYTMPTLGDVFFKTAVVGQYTWDPAAASNIVITTASKAIGTIQDPVGRTISGKITHGAGVALAGTSVSAIDTTASSSSFFFFFFGGGYATSGATGTWTIQGLRPGTYRIGASPSDYPPTNDVGGYYRTGLTGNYIRNLEQGSIVDVRTANQATLPINLPAGNTITGTIKGGAVGLEFASVTVYSMTNTEFFYGYASTDATGHYSIVGIPNGRFIVAVDSPYDKNYLDGYYRNAPVANFTAAIASATPVIFGDGTAPTITAKAPASGATGVSRLTNVTATFSEPVINVNTKTIYLRKAGTFINIAAVVTYNATTRQATLNPSVTLAASTSYTATIYDVYDGTGNQASASWSFTTGL